MTAYVVSRCITMLRAKKPTEHLHFANIQHKNCLQSMLRRPCCRFRHIAALYKFRINITRTAISDHPQASYKEPTV